MEFNELVKNRRSCRKYQESSITEDEIKQIIECGLMAPSWKNSETGRYYVATTKEAVQEVYDCLPDFNQNSTKNACAYIVATFKKGISGYDVNGNTTEGDVWGAYDLGLQNSYLLLKACELGYDTLIMGIRDYGRLRKYFNIPEDEMILPVIAIGKKDIDLQLRPRKKLEEVLNIK